MNPLMSDVALEDRRAMGISREHPLRRLFGELSSASIRGMTAIWQAPVVIRRRSRLSSKTAVLC
jgi:hypothetical protein